MVNKKPIVFGILTIFAFLAFASPVKANFAKEVEPIADCMVRAHYPNFEFINPKYT